MVYLSVYSVCSVGQTRPDFTLSGQFRVISCVSWASLSAAVHEFVEGADVVHEEADDDVGDHDDDGAEEQAGIQFGGDGEALVGADLVVGGDEEQGFFQAAGGFAGLVAGDEVGRENAVL